MEIEGSRVILRTIEDQDASLLKNLIEDHETAKVTGRYSSPISYTYQMSWFRRMQDSDGGLHNIIADRENPRMGLGIIILSNIDQEQGTAVIYIKLMRNARQKGYGQDAVNALASYAFCELGLNHLYSNIMENNEASRRLFEKCGFKQEDIHRSRGYKDGHDRNVYVYGRNSE